LAVAEPRPPAPTRVDAGRVRAMTPYLIAGTSFGCLYALLGLGLVLTLRSTNVMNFAQGEIATLMAFVCVQIALLTGIPILWAVVLALAAGVVCGTAFYNVLFYPVRRRNISDLAFLSLSLKLAITGLVALYWGSESRVFPEMFGTSRYQIAGVYVPAGQFWMIVCGFGGMIVVGAFLRLTNLGLAMRVAAEDGDTAQLLGVNLRVVGSSAWIAATCLATLAGVLVASTTFLSPFMMGLVILKVFAALVVGGMTSALGVAIGGLLLGVSESLVAYFLTPLLQDSVALIIVILVLMVLPHGVTGQSVWRA
jgi:branched-chain amino acid transport system permease protein